MTESLVNTTVSLDASGKAVADRSAADVVAAMLRAPLRTRMWKELAYLIAMFVLGMAGVVYLYFGLGAGVGLAVTIVGLPLLALVVLGGRWWGALHRALGATLLDDAVAAPPAFAQRPGFIGFVRSSLTDRTGWRAILFLVAETVVGLVGGYVVLVFVAMTMFTVVSPLAWLLFDPQNVDAAGGRHHSLMQFGDVYIETWPQVLGVALVGVLLFVFVVPWLVHGLCLCHGYLIRALLGPTARDSRIAELQVGRTAAVEDSAATLRRLERNLHDGTQARLVTVAMALGRAEERLAAGGDARELIADARADTKDALVELRELVRGIHPPALDLGLGPALETLASRSSVPVELDLGLAAERPSAAVEAIAYFSVAELLTNVVRHADASRAWVTARTLDGQLVVTVRDDGHGGADRQAGSGLSGLAARAGAVDGTLDVDSPASGPTVVTLTLPVAGSR